MGKHSGRRHVCPHNNLTIVHPGLILFYDVNIVKLLTGKQYPALLDGSKLLRKSLTDYHHIPGTESLCSYRITVFSVAVMS